MRHFFILISFSFGLSMFANAYETMPQRPSYEIVSTTLDTTIKRGYCEIVGVVIDQSGNKVNKALISNTSLRKQTYTNSQGEFVLTISSLDTSIFMYHAMYGEIVVRGYDFKSRHRVVINFNPTDPLNGDPEPVKKPVIYLYANQPTNVNVKLYDANETFTYPPMNDGWNVTVLPQGGLVDGSSGKTYPYLFWEGEKQLDYVMKNDSLPGVVLSRDEVVQYLENALSQAGLNGVEATDFITFWGPSLIEREYVLIQFISDDLYQQQIAGLSVNPQPESMLRLFMYYTPLDHPDELTIPLKNQTFIPILRKGLTLIEWGGAELSLPSDSGL